MAEPATRGEDVSGVLPEADNLMPQFARPAIVAACRTADSWYDSTVGAFLIEYGLEDVDRRAHRDSI